MIRRLPPRPARRERGVVMLFALIALVIMLVGAVALVRSSTASISTAANLGFKRDLTNQAERAVDAAVTLLNTGALASEVTRNSSSAAHNYSAKILASNAQGLPTMLVDDATFSTVGATANDIAVASQGVTIRYVIDRLCKHDATAAAESHCTMAENGQSPSCSSNPCEDLSDAVPKQAVYRLSVRITGPRRTQAYFQTTLTL